MNALRFYGERPPRIDGTDVPGRLIVIEGTDGVGRSTHVALLKEWLEARGYAVVNTGLRRSALAGRGIERAKRGNTLDPLTLNLLYATQYDTRPPRFRIVVNDRALVTRDYAYYVENQLRARLGLEGVPVIIDFQSRT